MGLKWRVTVEGDTVTLAAFLKVQEGIIDLNNLGAWDMVVSAFRKTQLENFESQGSKSAIGTWKSLSPAYEKIKIRKYGQKPILEATGAMKEEFTTSKGKVTKEPQELTFSFSSPAEYHMSKAPRSKMPYRSSLELTDTQKITITDPLVRKVKQLIQNARLAEKRGF